MIFLVAVLLGGGGSRYALSNLSVQLVAIGYLVFAIDRAMTGWRDLRTSLRVLVAITLLLPLVQLIPLPPALWQALPGGETALRSRELVGASSQWFPLTQDRARTVLAFAALVPPFVIAVLRPREDFSQIFVRLIVGLGVLNISLGAVQFVAGANIPYGYPMVETGRIYGLFANHNTSGLFFVVALCSLAGLEIDAASKRVQMALKIALGGLFVIGVLLTQSRSSAVLMLIPLLYFVFAFLRARSRSGRSLNWKVFVPVVAFALVVAWFGLTQERLGQTMERFGDLQDERPAIWRDTLAAITAYFPFGSGIGSFDEVFQYFESLETLSPAFARRAHNDYLELGVEAGILGWLLLGGWLFWGAWTWLAQKSRGLDGSQVAASLAILSIAGQSAIDYPLRNQAFLCLAVIFVVMLAGRSLNKGSGH
ncbi:O-antigen ligase family protein [Qipengyuania soli]|uniref:O-antigen ligase family protein n=1 Tax=Qipengyuania soli TaxID=2782568 RepID=UPI001FE61BA0|nr:O-antigen ligase family protein [Qipengyuania soli]